MGMASAYSGGAALQPRQSGSYQGVLDYLGRNRGGGGGGRAATAAVDLRRDQWEDDKSNKLREENAIRARYDGRISTPEEEAAYLKREEARRNRALADENRRIAAVDKEKAERQARINRGDKEYQARLKRGDERLDKDREYALKGRGMDIKEGAAKRTFDKEDFALQQERKSVDYQKMMTAFRLKNPDAMTAYFAKHAPRDEDGNVPGGVPIFSIDAQGAWTLDVPGQNTEVFDTKEKFKKLVELMVQQNPKWEQPTSEKAIAKTELTRAKAGQVGKPKMSDLIEDRKNRADLEGYVSPIGEEDVAIQPRGGQPSPGAEQPPAPGYQKAKDGNWYKMGQNGKYQKWTGGGSTLADEMANAGEMSAAEYQQSGPADEVNKIKGGKKAIAKQPTQTVTAETAIKPRGEDKYTDITVDKQGTVWGKDASGRTRRVATKPPMKIRDGAGKKHDNPEYKKYLDKYGEPGSDKKEKKKERDHKKKEREKKKKERDRKKKEREKKRKKKKSKGGKKK